MVGLLNTAEPLRPFELSKTVSLRRASTSRSSRIDAARTAVYIEDPHAVAFVEQLTFYVVSRTGASVSTTNCSVVWFIQQEAGGCSGVCGISSLF